MSSAVVALAWLFLLDPGSALAAMDDVPQPSPCEIANRAAPGVDASTLPAAIKNRMTAYRKGWRAFCARSPGHPTLDSLFGEAIAIMDMSNSNEIRSEAMEPLLDYERRQMPAMGPGMDSILYVYEEDFARAALTQGTAVDRFFWKRYLLVGSAAGRPPWMKPTHDYGGCTRHGEFDWIAALKTLEELESEELGPTYRRLTRDAGDHIYSVFKYGDGEGSCGDVAAVVADLQRVIGFVRSRPPLHKHLAPLAEKLQRLEPGAAQGMPDH
jgi:hypothetical protein